MPDVLTMLDTLADLREQQTALAATEAAALPARVRQRLAENAARFAPVRQGLARDITLLETQVKNAVLKHGASVKGARLQAVYVAGRPHWDDRALLGYALCHAEIVAFRGLGLPSVTLRPVKEKEDSCPLSS